MDASKVKTPTTLTDLPPELWNHIVNYLPTASSIANFGGTSKSLRAYAEKDGWKTFARTRFPSLCPTTSPSYRETARTLTSLAKAWDRRAFVARYIEPRGDVIAYPGGIKVDRWKRPKGQTIGFTPQLSVQEEPGSKWSDRNELLAFSAGAEICIRRTRRHGSGEDVRWTKYRPHSAFEGKDDVTTIHLLKSEDNLEEQKRHHVVVGTANGDLQLLRLPSDRAGAEDISITYFATQGVGVRNSTLYQKSGETTLLAATLGDASLALYSVDHERPKICPSSQIDVKPPLRADGHPAPGHRSWSTKFLSASMLAVGVGPSDTPLHMYTIAESGLSPAPVRKFGMQDESGTTRLSSVYTTAPLPSSTGASGNGDVFLSGAFDGIVRLHDLRSKRDAEQLYCDADDSAVYSILPRGQEKLLMGTSRHNLLKVFDLRLGAKAYSYLDIGPPDYSHTPAEHMQDFNIFLRPSNNSDNSRGRGWSHGPRRSAESSIYTLASSSPASPYIYAGIEAAVCSLAFTEITDKHPDPVYFDAWTAEGNSKTATNSSRKFRPNDVLSLAMYDQGANMKLSVQKGLWETCAACIPRCKDQVPLLDERWQGVNEFGT